MMIRAAIFDMDGLMFDTERLYGDAWLYAGRVTGFPITKELLNRTRGADRGSCISAFREALGDTFDFYAVRRYRQEYVDGYLEKNGMPLKPGLMELLGYLKHSGYGIGLATSTDEPTAREYLGMAGVSGYFDCMIFGDMVKKGKPAPDIYLKAAETLGRRPDECIVLEDSILGVRAGAAAGCHVIMIPDEVEPGEREKKLITRRMDSLMDVIAYLG
ncbi:HAD family phosphatase [Lachnoclostridium pacaense]|uniref:HAD family hydrolase n=1 Tax=Enterocloster hominis (ex Hitch et al. 2024) TaxID=1917870 RepID=UPI001D1213C7|nr:HAD family phosphatase [Lachnoclostridium pacaense]MCC2874763.1 HAD family phosphatase [Lachnoclostridium pacaense]